MTTIVYRNGILAADTLGCMGHLRMTNETFGKLRIVRDGIAAGVGTLHEILSLLDWLEAGRDGIQPFLGSESCVLHVTGEGCTIYEGRASYPVRAEYIARGSGVAIALGALAMGADAVRAVEVAAMFDTYTGGSVEKLSLAEFNDGGIAPWTPKPNTSSSFFRKPRHSFGRRRSRTLAFRELPSRAPAAVPQ